MTSKEMNHDQEPRRPVTARELRKAKEARKKLKQEHQEKQGGVDEEEVAQGQEEPVHTPETSSNSTEEQEPAEEQGAGEGEQVLPENPELVFQLLEEQLEKAKEEAAKWKRESEENEERVHRVTAELENFRRRAKKDREESVRYAAVPLVESLLPALDNLERALEAGADSEDAKSLHQGVEMVYRQLLQSLETHGLSQIEAKGQPFNPHEHDAVMEVEVDGVDSGMVVEELQKGYRYKDRVIRPSMVKVSS
ncbi:MAG: nucleotide exchange factor GrpE [Firmicutes bacterium]|uniref:Protein GrpE n=1 Tax=Melghirimyces thermohalophilus TaxID=1236220 RepID=A0A1G6P0Y8_9BACL|nr:nucleotide exchange factor GrpE [Melghirimyces thermohalophilus]MDA8354299.1 nucleotide exchange factor GrpE [Bacillota bacterium]SDC73940.1 molecular chaperone GrpE [Melghirimyces thermohalophilus]